MKRKTLILDINELYKTIPECKKLEGKNFKDIRELLTQLIAAIEESGEWEFIQHIQNKPSLFVVRGTLKVDIPKSEVSKTQFVKLEERINTISGMLSKVDLLLENPAAVKEEVVADLREIKKQAKESIYDNPLFIKKKQKDVKEILSNVEDAEETAMPKDKLPWE